jgi:S-methylmethionine-dependent homocysteine/selenocysteine methylase
MNAHHDNSRNVAPMSGEQPRALYRDRLPHASAEMFLADGGLETTLIFDDGIDLPDFAAFLLLRDEGGRAALTRYFDTYAELAARDGVGIVLETATWRASADWARRHDIDDEQLAQLNRDAVELVDAVRRRQETAGAPIVISGSIGPRGDGYVVGDAMDVETARQYHALQIDVFAGSAADLVTAMTMTYVEEAIGIALGARDAGVPVVISFTVETDGRLPSGQSLADAIAAVDAATDGYPAYYMVNCAHPTHFDALFAEPGPWERLGGMRANASTKSHAELDEAVELDPGDPVDLAARYRELRALVPTMRVFGGCCGTNHVHIGAISAACRAGA